MRKNWFGLALLFGLVSALGVLPADAQPSCAGAVEIAKARIVRVEQNGVLVLSDGRAMVLEGVRLPMGVADHAPARLADEARAALRNLTSEAPVMGRAVPPKEDRYDRVRVQGFAGRWLQQALLEEGLARVAILPDREECAAELYGFEAAARRGGRGLWAQAAYRIRTTNDDWRPDLGTFQLIEDKLGRVTARDDATLLDFSSDGRNGLLAVISGADRRNFRGADLDRLVGRRLRVRGIVQEMDGRPVIVLSSPAQIEILN
ncbi:MAG: thermonuclease family protein [Alphaproteobacteria bacterium]|nr:thermonuclease family protein [Alphaproteobacteria bacterium]